MKIIPKAVFLTKGVGCDRRPFSATEAALRNAEIAPFNLVPVNDSSIFPPRCKLISRKAGLEQLAKGQAAFCVLSENSTDEHRRLLAASIGLAYPTDRNKHGFIARRVSFGETEETAGEYAEDIAVSMLAASLGARFNLERSWDAETGVYRISHKVVRSLNIVQSALGRQGFWTSVVAAAVFVA